LRPSQSSIVHRPPAVVNRRRQSSIEAVRSRSNRRVAAAPVIQFINVTPTDANRWSIADTDTDTTTA